MFKRSLQVKLVKIPKNETLTVAPEKDFEDIITVIGNVFDKFLYKAAMIALGYVILDTAREVIVNKSK